MTELYATAALAFVVFALTNDKNNSNKALTSTLIGLTVGALVSIIAPITQCGSKLYLRCIFAVCGSLSFEHMFDTTKNAISHLSCLYMCAVNPARDFGPRIMAYLAGWDTVAFQGWWVYVFAPIIGAPIGAFVADELLYGAQGGNDIQNLTLPMVVDDGVKRHGIKRQPQDKIIEV